MEDEHYENCDVVKAVKAWQDMVAQQEEHSELSGMLLFEETQSRAGWTEHQSCILPLVEQLANDVMESKTPAEAYLLVQSALCQLALICFIMGRQREGAEV